MALNELDLSGLRVFSARVTIPLVGAWVADVELPDDTALPPGPMVLSIGNLSLVGAVVRQDSLAGSRQVRLVGGAGGWATALEPQSYHDDGGIPRATPLRDLALLAGEVLFPADLAAAVDVVGVDYVREAAPASRTLEQLVGEKWWIDPLGMTHILPRPSGTPIPTQYLVQEYDAAQGRVVVSTEDWASFVPGAVLASPLLDQPMTLVNVAIVADGGDAVRIEALVEPGGGPPGGLSDRVLGLLRTIIRSEIRALTFVGTWEYQVTSASVDGAGRSIVDGLPLAASPTLPPLRQVVLRPGVPGAQIIPQIGSTLLVAFVNADPARPVVVSYDATPPKQVSIGTGPLGVQNVAIKGAGSDNAPSIISLEADGSGSSISIAATGAGSTLTLNADTPLGVTVGDDTAMPLAHFAELEAWASNVTAALAALTPPHVIPPLAPTCATTKLRSN